MCKAVYSDKELVSTGDGDAVFPGAPIFDDDGNMVGREADLENDRPESADPKNLEQDDKQDDAATAAPQEAKIVKQTLLFSATLNINLEGREQVCALIALEGHTRVGGMMSVSQNVCLLFCCDCRCYSCCCCCCC